MYSRSEGELHERLIRAQIKAYKGDKVEVVAADVEGWPQPSQVGSHVPDIIAKRGDRTVYNECETPATIGSDQTREQCQDFSQHGDLEITVPESCFLEARQNMAQWDIVVKKWWTYTGK